MDFHAFAASARPVSDVLWADIQTCSHKLGYLPRENYIQFGLPDEEYLIHTTPEGYHVHAWWYPPICYPSLADAISHLWKWRMEWADAA